MATITALESSRCKTSQPSSARWAMSRWDASTLELALLRPSSPMQWTSWLSWKCTKQQKTWTRTARVVTATGRGLAVRS
eukprot:3299768-Rhodomonas_salina.4